MKIRAFVFDDNDIIRSLVSSILKKRGYEVYEFLDAGTCPLFLEYECPCPLNYTCGDFIITDIHMPSMTGLDFIENQLRQGGCKSMNFAVMSADWTDLQLQQAKRLGCYVLKKPFDPQELIDWLVECEKKIDPKRKLSDWFKFKDKKTSH